MPELPLHRREEQSLEVGTRAGPRVGLVADVACGDVNQSRQVRFRHAMRNQTAMNANTGFQDLSQGTNALPPPATPQTMRQLVKLLRYRFKVPRHDGIDHQRIGQAVVQVVDSAQRVRAGVHGPRSFWKAMATIIDAIIMSLRACRLPGS